MSQRGIAEAVTAYVSYRDEQREAHCALIRSIRTLPSATKDIPAIALSAFAHSADRTRALVAGFNRYLEKPVEANLLLSTVADLIGSRVRIAG